SVLANTSLLNQSIDHISNVISSFESLDSDAPWSKLGYFDATQHDAIEHLFFRFLVSRRVLVSLALQENTPSSRTNGGDESSKGDDLQRALARAESSFADESMTDTTHALQTMIILASAIALLVYDGKFIKCFCNDNIAIAKLNEKFYRSDIDFSTYNQLRLECTDTTIINGRMTNLTNAYKALYCDESNVHNVVIKDSQAEVLSTLIDSLAKEADGLVQEYLEQPIRFLRMDRIKHRPIADAARNAKSGTKNALRETRALTFKAVSRLKSPRAYLIKFSSEQKRDVLERLRPGDLIFTYTAGYVSDIFIPGAFKHGITYVGGPMDRTEAGLTADNIARIYDDLPAGEAQTLLQQFRISALPSRREGEEALEADVIEAVAEGVIFNNLCRLMDTHVNRFLVLRPRITDEERTDALISTFRFLGDKYDFGFNFGDASAVVCTEVQYHSFNGKGGLSFELTKRAGNPTLSADDIVNYHLTKPGNFDFVLLALEDKDSSCHDAEIYVGEDGKGMLADLMKSESR
ncbi:hypothetical protein ACHAWF_001583, partial [Thalassiosira exigua]